jgi:hypothetical protein
MKLRNDYEIFREESLKRGIKVLYHATFAAALSAIYYTGGLWSRKRMTVPPFRLPNPGRPLDGLPRIYEDHLSLSVKPYQEFIKRQIKYTKNSVCLILVDASIIEYEGVAFSPYVTADEKIAGDELKNTSIEDFRDLFRDANSSKTVSPSSKISVPAHIPKRFFRGNVFATEEEMRLAIKTIPDDIGHCYCDPSLFPRSTLDPSKKVSWPKSAEEIYRFWMEFLGFGR